MCILSCVQSSVEIENKIKLSNFNAANLNDAKNSHKRRLSRQKRKRNKQPWPQNVRLPRLPKAKGLQHWRMMHPKRQIRLSITKIELNSSPLQSHGERTLILISLRFPSVYQTMLPSMPTWNRGVTSWKIPFDLQVELCVKQRLERNSFSWT